MSNVRDYLKEREKRLGSAQTVTYKDKIRSHKLTIFYRGALIAALAAAVVFFLVFQWKNKVFTESTVVSSSDVTIVQGASVERLGSNILLFSKDGASCFNSKGSALWNQTFEMQSPMLSLCGDVAALADYNGRTIYVVSSTAQLGTISTNLPIRRICISANGVVAAVLDDADVTRIMIYNGNETTETPIVTIKATMDKSGYPMSLSLSPNGKLLAISYFYVDGGAMKSSVGFFNFGEVGKNESDNYVSGFDYLNTVIPYVQFMSDSAAFGVSDDRIIFFQGSERPGTLTSNLIEEEVQSIYYNEDYVGLVFMDQTGEAAYRLDVYDASGKKIYSRLFDMEYSDIIFHNDLIIIYNDMDCQICNIRGVDKYEGEFEKPVSLMVPTSSVYKYFAVTENSVDTIELK